MPHDAHVHPFDIKHSTLDIVRRHRFTMNSHSPNVILKFFVMAESAFAGRR
jgi:hypothetical protein